ncbi:MAG TPA: hypothetical protein VIS07_00995 [Candidatus Binatia bacterium]
MPERKGALHAPPPAAPDETSHDETLIAQPDPGPIVAGPRESAAAASRPEHALDGRYLHYEENPAPWWVGLMWVAFFLFSAVYLVVGLVG